MPNEPDYKTACETLLRAIDESTLILEKAAILVQARLGRQEGKPLEEEILDFLKESIGRSSQ